MSFAWGSQDRSGTSAAQFTWEFPKIGDSRILTIRAPKYGTPDFRKLPRPTCNALLVALITLQYGLYRCPIPVASGATC